MNKKKRKLALSRETVRDLEDWVMNKVAGGVQGSDKRSEWYPFCWPSAVNTVCHTECPCFTCTRAIDAEPAQPVPK